MSKERGEGHSARRGGEHHSTAPKFMMEPPIGPMRLRLTEALLASVLADLRRPHPVAMERIGFLSVATGQGEDGEMLVLGVEYHPVADEHYVPDRTVGARIGTEAIRDVIWRTLRTKRGLLHVHLHDFPTPPRFSPQDRADQPRLIEALARAEPSVPHGMLVLSQVSAAAWLWLPGATQPVVPELVALVGYPMTLIAPSPPAGTSTFSVVSPIGNGVESKQRSGAKERFARQSFLGPNSQTILGRARIGIVGLGGGGSHVAQQLAHLGVSNPRSFDGDTAEDSNLNRLIGARADDVELKTLKTEIARRLYQGLLPSATPVFHPGRWQDRPELLRGCDVVIGCVDTFAGRHELEVACRRYAIPYIDIGMDVHEVSDDPPRMAGQIILSMPGGPCMWCLQFLDDEKLGREAQRYGDVGGRPQVVWPNGVLASAAVGIAVDLLTGWTRRRDRVVYLVYDGNTGEVRPHPRLDFVGKTHCRHYGTSPTGDPVFRRVRPDGEPSAAHWSLAE